MKNAIIYLLIVVSFAQCTRKKQYDPDAILSPHQKDEMMMKIIRYVARAPENVKPIEIFNSEYDSYYQERAGQCFLEQYFVIGDSQYFLVSQPAPSLTEKRHATGGVFVLDDNGKVQGYQEIFRTWKMAPDTLRKRSHFLFDKMVKRESLEPFYTNKTGDNYIEFPDDKTFYDTDSRTWKTKEVSN